MAMDEVGSAEDEDKDDKAVKVVKGEECMTEGGEEAGK